MQQNARIGVVKTDRLASSMEKGEAVQLVFEDRDAKVMEAYDILEDNVSYGKIERKPPLYSGT